MAYADKERQRAAQRRSYEKSRLDPAWVERGRARARARGRRMYVKFQEFKATLACERCGERHPSCLQFHHRDRGEISFRLGGSVSRSWESIMAEFAKCEVLCANCHKKEHWPGLLSSVPVDPQ